MILVAITNRASYPRCKTMIDALGEECRVFLMDPEPDIEGGLKEKTAFASTARTYGGGALSMANSAAKLLADCALALYQLSPKAVVVVGDRHEVLSVAMAFRIANVPVIHLLAGERSGSVDDDIRFAISALSDLLLAPHEEARSELIKRGYHVAKIKVTGCPSIDLCQPPYETTEAIEKYGYGAKIRDGDRIALCCHHPDTTTDAALNIRAIERIAEILKSYAGPVVWVRPSMHDAFGADMNKRLSQLAKPNWRIVRHVPHRLMLSLLNDAKLMIGNSSMMYREAAYMGVPCYAIGDRQLGRHVTKNIISVIDLLAPHPMKLDSTRFESDSLWQPGGGKRAAQVVMERYCDRSQVSDG